MTQHTPELVHIIGAVLLPLVGLTLGVLARRSLGPTPRRADVLWCLSLVCAWLGLTLWPHAITALVDGASHVRGLAHIVSDTLITSAFVFQFAFTCTVGKRWTWGHKGAIALYVAILAAYAAQWAMLHNAYSFYGTYAGHPLQLLAANTTLAALILWSAALAISGYASYLPRRAHSSERMVAVGITFVASLEGFYGILIVGQLVASALGFGSTQIATVTGPIMVLASSAAALVIWLLTGKRSRPLRAYAQSIFALRQREDEVEERECRLDEREARLDEREGNIADLAVWVQDQLVQIHVEIDKRPVDEVTTWCAASGLIPYRKKVALTTTRLVLLGEARVLRVARYDLDLLPHEADMDGAQDDLAQEVEGEETFLSDVLRVLQLVDPRPLPDGIEPRVEPPGWRREVAEAISTALRRDGRLPRFA